MSKDILWMSILGRPFSATVAGIISCKLSMYVHILKWLEGSLYIMKSVRVTTARTLE